MSIEKPQLLESIRSYYYKNNGIPSFSEVMELWGVKSKAVVYFYFQKWTKQGFFVKKDNKYFATDALIGIPLAQTVPAGFDAPSRDENRYESINLNSYLIERPNSTFLLEVSGDSMLDAGITPGDKVIVDRSLTARDGDVVVATIDGAFTLKYLSKDKKWKVALLAANKTRYKDPLFPSESMEIVGVVISSFRKYR